MIIVLSSLLRADTGLYECARIDGYFWCPLAHYCETEPGDPCDSIPEMEEKGKDRFLSGMMECAGTLQPGFQRYEYISDLDCEWTKFYGRDGELVGVAERCSDLRAWGEFEGSCPWAVPWMAGYGPTDGECSQPKGGSSPGCSSGVAAVGPAAGFGLWVLLLWRRRG